MPDVAMQAQNGLHTSNMDSPRGMVDRTERFYRTDQLLKKRKVVSFAALREAIGVSRATLRHDLDYMRDRLHAPIDYDRDANGYRFGKPRSGPRYELPGWRPSLTDARSSRSRCCRGRCKSRSLRSRSDNLPHFGLRYGHVQWRVRERFRAEGCLWKSQTFKLH